MEFLKLVGNHADLHSIEWSSPGSGTQSPAFHLASVKEILIFCMTSSSATSDLTKKNKTNADNYFLVENKNLKYL